MSRTSASVKLLAETCIMTHAMLNSIFQEKTLIDQNDVKAATRAFDLEMNTLIPAVAASIRIMMQCYLACWKSSHFSLQLKQ